MKGIFFACAANGLFGSLYFFSVLLLPLSGESIFGFRILVLLPAILFALFFFKQQADLKHLFQRLKKHPSLFLILLFNAAISGVQLWLFLWAGGNGYALDVSIGYLLLPIMMSAMGKFCFGETISRIKQAAIFIALFGVLTNIFLAGGFSWASLIVCLGYPLYWFLRKHFQLNNLATFAMELMCLLPVACVFVSQIPYHNIIQQNPHLPFYLIGLGVISGTAFILYISASQLLPLNLLGLLGYLEPAIMLCIAFFIGEVLKSESYLLMCCLLMAIFLLMIDGVKNR